VSDSPITPTPTSTILEGILVLDLSRVLAGPWSTQILADLGATVIKVEHPAGGDDTRGFGPPFFEVPEGELSAYFMSANRGKQSVCIDISQPEGVDLILRIAEQADILVENFKFGDLEKKGLGYERVRQVNPGIVYCSITGFGHTGPARHKPGYDMVVQGMAGLMSITGESDANGGQPQKVGVALADVMTGLYSTIAILAALREKEQSGEGQHIDMALMDVVTAALANQASNYLVTGDAPGRLGNEHPNIVPYQVFQTLDGYVIVAVANDAQFARYVDVLGHAELADDDRYKSNADRVRHRDVLGPLLSDIMRTRTMDDWLTRFEASGVPVSPINTIDRVFSDEQSLARGMKQEIEGVPLVSSPLKFSRSTLTSELRPPLLGEHERVLIDLLNLTNEEFEALKSRNTIGKKS
jgi:crotonobetainyl-CoA:carnitine CoA-transferase CaiB-like acyl-CoA transferase